MRKLSPLPRSCGFTLIELMIVVAVIGVLLAIGVPNYQEYVLRSKLTDSLSSMSQLRVTLEQYFQDNRSYDLAPAAPANNCGVVVAARNSDYFTYTCDHQRRPCSGSANWPGLSAHRHRRRGNQHSGLHFTPSTKPTTAGRPTCRQAEASRRRTAG
jgi:prepilin-type N-terminal cleavage/methylation domain-containing protein